MYELFVDLDGVLVDFEKGVREWLRPAWEELGGVFIHHREASTSIDELERLLGVELEPEARDA